MSNYQIGDIVEFFNGENMPEFGLIISVQISDTISALVVSGFAPNHPQWISTDRVKNHWKNLKGYVSTCDILKAENERLKADLEIQKNLTRQQCFLTEEAFKEADKWKKMFYDLCDKQARFSTDPKVIVINPATGKGGEDE